MNKYIKLMDTMKHQKSAKRVYNAEIWKYLKGSEVFTVTDSYGNSTRMLKSHVDDFFTKHTLKNGWIIRDKGFIYVETFNPRYGAITDKYLISC